MVKDLTKKRICKPASFIPDHVETHSSKRSVTYLSARSTYRKRPLLRCLGLVDSTSNLAAVPHCNLLIMLLDSFDRRTHLSRHRLFGFSEPIS